MTELNENELDCVNGGVIVLPVPSNREIVNFIKKLNQMLFTLARPVERPDYTKKQKFKIQFKNKHLLLTNRKKAVIDIKKRSFKNERTLFFARLEFLRNSSKSAFACNKNAHKKNHSKSRLLQESQPSSKIARINKCKRNVKRNKKTKSHRRQNRRNQNDRT